MKIEKRKVKEEKREKKKNCHNRFVILITYRYMWFSSFSHTEKKGKKKNNKPSIQRSNSAIIDDIFIFDDLIDGLDSSFQI